ncbi:MAG: T9SS type A sorting domain-containing protein, partial [Flavobacterium sp.]
ENKWNALNTNETFFNDTKVYPTYTNDYLNIETDLTETSYKIYDLSGKLINQDINQTKIDVSNYSNGFYILQFSAGNASKTYKFIKK